MMRQRQGNLGKPGFVKKKKMYEGPKDLIDGLSLLWILNFFCAICHSVMVVLGFIYGDMTVEYKTFAFERSVRMMEIDCDEEGPDYNCPCVSDSDCNGNCLLGDSGVKRCDKVDGGIDWVFETKAVYSTGYNLTSAYILFFVVCVMAHVSHLISMLLCEFEKGDSVLNMWKLISWMRDMILDAFMDCLLNLSPRWRTRSESWRRFRELSYKASYIGQLKSCRNHYRWAEYSISASLMMIVICASCQMASFWDICNCTVLVGLTMMFGFWQEERSRPEQNIEFTRLEDSCSSTICCRRDSNRLITPSGINLWVDGDLQRTTMPMEFCCFRVNGIGMIGIGEDCSVQLPNGEVNVLLGVDYPRGTGWTRGFIWRMMPYVAGWIPYMLAWAQVLGAFFDVASQSIEDEDGISRKMPDFVYAIVLGEFAMFSCFAAIPLAVNMMEPRSYFWGEIVYCLLSGTSKIYLGALCLANIKMLNEVDSL